MKKDIQEALEQINLGMKSFDLADEVSNVFEAGISVGICIERVENARSILENLKCPHPYFQVEAYHDGAMICNECGKIISQNGERFDEPVDP